MISNVTSLRHEFVNRIKRENPSLEKLDGPVIETDNFVPSWGIRAVGQAARVASVLPQAVMNEEKKFPSVAKLLRQVEKAVFATLPIEGAVVGLAFGDADEFQDDENVQGSAIHALSLKAPFISQEPLGSVYLDHAENKAYVHLTKDKVEVAPLPELRTGQKLEEDRAVLQTIRDLFEETGARFYGTPTEPHQRGRTSADGKLILDFDYGTPQTLSTPSGNFEFASSGMSLEHDSGEKFLKSLREIFDIKEISPKRDDSLLGPGSHTFQHQKSGPVLEISPKKGVKMTPFRGYPESMKKPEGFTEQAVEQVLETFLATPSKSDEKIDGADAGDTINTLEMRRNEFAALDEGEAVNGIQDIDEREGHIKYGTHDTFEIKLDGSEVVEKETSRYIGETIRIERKTENGFEGIVLEGSGRYAEGHAFSVTQEGGRIRKLFFKETLEGKV